MKVQCTICDKIDDIIDDSFQAKRLRNKRSYMYLCNDCNERIAKNTEARHATGKFKLYQDKQDKDEYI